MSNTNTAGHLTSFADSNSLLNCELADLAGLPEFKVPTAGRYTLSLDNEFKELNGHETLILKYTVVGIIEQADATATPPLIGDSFGESFRISSDIGVGKLKAALAVYGEQLGLTNVGDIINAIKGLVIEGTVIRREDKEKLDAAGNKKIYGSVVGAVIQ